MARKRREYPNTGWGREAEWEDIQTYADSECRFREPGEYRAAYVQAKSMLERGESATSIRAAFLQTPNICGRLDDGRSPFTIKCQEEVERRLARVREKAVKDLLGGQPC